jgi:hypothetical protein
MDESRRNILKKKRERDQKKQEISSYCNQHLIPWLEIYRSLNRKNAEFQLEYLAASLDEPMDLFEETLISILPESERGLVDGLLQAPVLPVHQKMEQAFPSRQKLRYLPGKAALKRDPDVSKMVDRALGELSISADEECMICYSIYTPVVTMRVSEMLRCSTTLFEPPENVAVLAKNYNWIIFRSLEEEWIWQKKLANNSI